MDIKKFKSMSKGKKEVDFLLVSAWFSQEMRGDEIPMLPELGAETPWSMALLLAYIEQEGFHTHLLDLNIETYPIEVLSATLKEINPKVVGISSYSANILDADKIAKSIKAYDDAIPILLGGFHASAMPEECLTRYKYFDYVMFGECEKALPIMLGNLLNNNPVDDTPNLAYRKDEKIFINESGPSIDNLDVLPFPLLDKIQLSRYKPLPPNFYRLPTIGIMASRGCPFKCTFCATHFQWNKNVRKISSGRLIDWLEKIIADYGIRDFRFYDDTFTIPKRFIQEFCEDVLNRKLDISWNCYSRVDTITEPMAKLMKKAGCYHIKFGIEAGTESSLKRIKKNISLKQALDTVEMVKNVGIETKASFILGIQNETIEDSQKTIDFALEVSPDFATFLIMMVYPGSEDFETWKREDKIPKDFNWDRPLYANEKNIKELQKLIKKAYKKFYLRPKFFKDRIKYFLRNPKCEIIRDMEILKYFKYKAFPKKASR